ncbi:MAG: TRAM domain-containing protein [Gemmatimonadaceae bacterium]
MEALTELSIESIAAGGDGVARHDGLVVFVPRGAPGDRVTVRLKRDGRFARGRIDQVLVAGPQRVGPRCSHYEGDHCGGCQLQHLDYDGQLQAKLGVVNDALQRIARSSARLDAVDPSPIPWAYRTKLTLTVRRHEASCVVGLRHHDNPDHVFELRECPITDARVVAAWREVGAARGLFPLERTLSAAIRLDGDELVFVLNGGRSWPSARSFAAACPSLAVVRWHPQGRGGSARVIVDRRVSGLPAASFQQVNPAVATMMHEAVLERAMSLAPNSAIDGYSGSGATAVALHARGVRVTAIELDHEASEYCAERLSAPSRAVAARAEDALPAALPADLVILNPPRNGVEETVTRSLDAAAETTRAILYVSCNPATLARDIQRLPQYRVSWLRAFDMFPQTAHVETVCELVPERL